VKLEVIRTFTIGHPGSTDEAIAYLRDVRKSLARVSFIRDLRVEGDNVFADLVVDVPVLGEQRLDFHSRLESAPNGANLIALPKQGRAWAEVSGEGRVTPANFGSSIEYTLRITAHLEMPTAEKWGGRAFEKMARATAEKAIDRMTLEFPKGVQAGYEL
jgi:carbon monoxide dehydrogenase subunit G